MSKKNRFDSLLDEMNYYKNLTDITVSAILDNSNTINFGTSALVERAEKIKYCGTTIGITFNGDRDEITSANFCRLRLCPLCQRRKALKTYADISRLVDALPNRTWVHMVLTVRNVSADELSQSVNKLFNDSTKLLRKNSDMRKAFNGALRCLEVTYNPDRKDYHPHLHILLTGDKSLNNNSRKRISKKRLAALWKESASLDYDPQVHIDYTVDDNVVAEIAKYCVKPLELSLAADERVEVLGTLFAALHGRRLMQSYGEIKTTLARLKIDLNESPEIGTDEVENKSEQMFVYNFEHAQYEKDVRFYNLRKVK